MVLNLLGVNDVTDQTFKAGNQIISLANEKLFSATGSDITPDFTDTIRHCQTVLDELNERKQRSDELSEVRKLRLQQCLQLKTCERDAEQVSFNTCTPIFYHPPLFSTFSIYLGRSQSEKPRKRNRALITLKKLYFKELLLLPRYAAERISPVDKQ